MDTDRGNLSTFGTSTERFGTGAESPVIAASVMINGKTINALASGGVDRRAINDQATLFRPVDLVLQSAGSDGVVNGVRYEDFFRAIAPYQLGTLGSFSFDAPISSTNFSGGPIGLFMHAPYDGATNQKLAAASGRFLISSVDIRQVTAAVPEPATWALMIVDLSFWGSGSERPIEEACCDRALS